MDNMDFSASDASSAATDLAAEHGNAHIDTGSVNDLALEMDDLESPGETEARKDGGSDKAAAWFAGAVIAAVVAALAFALFR